MNGRQQGVLHGVVSDVLIEQLILKTSTALIVASIAIKYNTLFKSVALLGSIRKCNHYDKVQTLSKKDGIFQHVEHISI